MAKTPLSRLARDLNFGAGGSAIIPKLIYGTAWKEERTEELVHTAMRAGFRAMDAAGRSRHYREDLVGEGFRRACREGVVQERDIFIQSKISPLSLTLGGIESLRLSLRECIADSLSLRSLGGDQYLDAYLLHIPLPTVEETLGVWEVLSEWTPSHIRHLGISNVDLDFLTEFYDKARIKPAIVQNRFCRDDDYDVLLRKFCREKGIVYQSFWTLTANKHLLRSFPVAAVAQGAGVSKPVAYYSLVLGLQGISILDGTTSEEHMREDLEGIDRVGVWAEGVGASDWGKASGAFKELIGEV